MRDNEFTKILGWPGYRVYRQEIDEAAKTLRLWVRRKQGNRKLICSGCWFRQLDLWALPRIWCRSGPDVGNGIGLGFMGGEGKTRGLHKHARPYVWRLAVLKQLADGANLIGPFPESSMTRALHSGRLRKRAEG